MRRRKGNEMYLYIIMAGFSLAALALGYLILHRGKATGGQENKEKAVTEKKGGKSLQQFFGFRKFSENGTETNSGTLAFYEIKPNNLTVLPEHVTAEQIWHLQMILQQEEGVELLCLDGSDTGKENLRFLQRRIAEEENPRIRKLLEADREAFEAAHLANTSIRQFYIAIRMQNLTEAQQERRITEVGRLLREHNLTAHRLSQAEVRHMLGIYFIGYMYAETWKEDYYDSAEEGGSPESKANAGLPGERAGEAGGEERDAAAIPEAAAVGGATVPEGNESEGKALSADAAGGGETGEAGAAESEAERTGEGSVF